MKHWLLALIVFICGASLMILELVGSRILAPFVGTSLIVWTTLIGVILAALSFGYFIGGRFADKNPQPKKLGIICILSGVFVAVALWMAILIPHINVFLIKAYSLSGATLIISIIIFVIPSILLGAVSPYALRLALTDTKSSGAIAGKLYAISTIGSIVGTFAAGFILIPNLGSFKTLVLISLLLVLSGLVLVRTKVVFLSLVIVIFSGCINWYQPNLLSSNKNIIAEFESAYNRLFLVKGVDAATKRPIISLMSGPHLAQSAKFADGDEQLVFQYTKFFRMADYFHPAIKRALMIGGGAYSYPQEYLKTHAGTIAVVEIDPLYTELAKKYFNLVDNERLSIYHEDARVFLSNSQQLYDVIYVDVFNNAGSVPFQLATREVITEINNHLTDYGVVVVNLVGSFNGIGSDFIASEYATYKVIFPNVKLFPLQNPGGSNIQNIMLVAIKNTSWPSNINANNEQQAFLDKAYNYNNTAKILTDDWAPVDFYLSGLY